MSNSKSDSKVQVLKDSITIKSFLAFYFTILSLVIVNFPIDMANGLQDSVIQFIAYITIVMITILLGLEKPGFMPLVNNIKKAMLRKDISAQDKMVLIASAFTELSSVYNALFLSDIDKKVEPNIDSKEMNGMLNMLRENIEKGAKDEDK